MKMSLPVIHLLFFIVVSFTMQRCEGESWKHVPSPRKESETTFLSLTAPRTDEGVWIARFAQYEISIELRSHAVYDLKEVEDTWTVKVKHKNRKFLPEEDTPESDVDDDEDSVFEKVQHHGKRKKQKSRRQLSSKSNISQGNTTEAHSELDISQSFIDGKLNSSAEELFQNSSNGVHLLEASIAPKDVDMIDSSTAQLLNDTRKAHWDSGDIKQLVQGTDRYTVIFGNSSSDSSDVENNEFQQLNDHQWSNVNAVVFDSNSLQQNHPTTEDATSTEAQESFSEPYALPLRQNFHLMENNNHKSPSFTESDTIDSQESPNVFKGNDHLEDIHGEVHTNDSGVFDDSDNKNYNPYVESDYVIEDTRDRTFNENGDDYDYDDGRSKEKHIEDKGYGDFEPTSEMKRIMDWYPRSKLLSVQNNGYKYFPPVGWFKLVTWPDRWPNARKVCEDDSANLAIPDTKEKVEIFLEIFRNYPDVLEKTILNNQVYVGVYNAGSPNNFTTVLGKPFRPDFPIWFENEPDNADPGEDCVTFHAQGRIRDVPCFYNLPFLCEKDTNVS